MKKLITILTVVVITTTISFSQISDRVNDESTYLLGARPVAGNIGFFIGISTAEISDLSNKDWNESGIPIINIKYYWSDKFVIKGGVQVWKKRRVLDGTLDPNSGMKADLTSYTHKEVDAYWNLNLGIEQHFDISNIIDSYIGINGNIGYNRSVRTTNMAWDGGDFTDNEGSSFGITYGFETVVGTNLYIADLPLAIGFEWGIRAKNYGANKYQYDYSESFGGTTSSGTYYTSLIDDFEDATANSYYNSVDFTDLKAKRFDIEPIARVTFTYYLKQ